MISISALDLHWKLESHKPMGAIRLLSTCPYVNSSDCIWAWKESAEPINQSINQSVSQSVSQPASQTVSQSDRDRQTVSLTYLSLRPSESIDRIDTICSFPCEASSPKMSSSAPESNGSVHSEKAERRDARLHSTHLYTTLATMKSSFSIRVSINSINGRIIGCRSSAAAETLHRSFLI